MNLTTMQTVSSPNRIVVFLGPNSYLGEVKKVYPKGKSRSPSCYYRRLRCCPTVLLNTYEVVVKVCAAGELIVFCLNRKCDVQEW
jgi:hypothetical protein